METYYDEIDDDVLILVADGGLDHDETEALAQKLEHLVDAGLRKVIVDCSRINTITSVALGMLVRLNRRLKDHGGDIKIAAVEAWVPRSFRSPAWTRSSSSIRTWDVPAGVSAGERRVMAG